MGEKGGCRAPFADSWDHVAGDEVYFHAKWRLHTSSRLARIDRLLVKCGIAACGMRKVKCGMEYAEYFCGTVGNMRNAESCPVGGRMRFHTGCKVQGWWWGYVGLATFVCSSDLSCKFQL